MTARITRSRAHGQWLKGRDFFNARKKDQVFEIKAKRLLGSFLGQSLQIHQSLQICMGK
jgi:hypothetical protein